MKLPHKPGLFERLGAKRAEEQEQTLRRVVRTHLCLVDLKAQRGSEQDWQRLLRRVALGLALARTHFSSEVVAEVHRALSVLSLIHATAPGRAGYWYVSEREASLLGPALVLTDHMEALCSGKELAAALQHSRQLLAE